MKPIIEGNIETDSLDHCSKAIVESLEQNDETDIGRALRNFDDELHDINLSFELVDSIPGSAAQAGVDNQYNFYIEISQQSLENCTDLYAAHTIMHEIIHSYMFSLISRTDPNYYGTSIGDLPGIPETFSGFVETIISDTTNMTLLEQHNFMANFFVSTMADALYDFDNESQNYEYYWCLSWGGLYETDVWTRFQETPALNDVDKGKFAFALTKERMDKIQQIDYAEQESTPDAKGSKFDENGDCFD